ncbi:MAG TPA: GtrA family protein [Chitinophagaceae bacterium]
MLTNKLTNLIDFFYPPFRRWMPLQTFRYAACGSANTLLGYLVYTVGLKYIFTGKSVDLGFLSFESYVAALIVSFMVSFPVGFLLMRFVVFIDSTIRARQQLFRYFFVFISNLFLNWLLLKALVKKLYINGYVAQAIATAIVIVISYLAQRHYTFKVEQTEID